MRVVTPLLLLLVSLALVAACGLFVAAEFSLVTVDRPSVERAAAAGDERRPRRPAALRSLSTQLSGAQVGITVTNLAIGFLAEPAIADLIDDPLAAAGVPEGVVTPLALALGLVLATVVTMIFGELVPKNLAIARPLPDRPHHPGLHARLHGPDARARSGCSTGRPTRSCAASASSRRRSSAPPGARRSSPRWSQRSADQGTLDADTAELVERSVEFGTRTAGEIMTPRVRTTTVEDGDRVSAVIDLARQTGHSRFPVLDAEDTVVGTVHVKQAVAVPVHERATTRVKHVMVKPVVVPESLRLDPLLALLREDGFQMAIVLDEYGGTRAS